MKIRTRLNTRSLLNTLLVVATASLSALAFGAANPGTSTTPTGNVPSTPITVLNDPSSAHFLQKFVDFMTLHPNGYGHYQINYALDSNQASGLCAYAEGTLDFSPAHLGLLNGKLASVPATFSTPANGPKNELFSDRRYTLNNNAFGPSYPFDPSVPDNLGISVNASTGQVTLTLKSWGNARITFDTVADPGAGVIYGFAQAGPGKPRQIVTLSLQKLFYQIPG